MTMPRNMKKVSWIALALVIGTLASSQSVRAEEYIYLWGSIDAGTASKLSRATDGFADPVPGELYPLTITVRDDGSLRYNLWLDQSGVFEASGTAVIDKKGNVTASNSIVGTFSGWDGLIFGDVRSKFTIYVTPQ